MQLKHIHLIVTHLQNKPYPELMSVSLPQVLGYADYVFTSVFTVEIVLKVTLQWLKLRTFGCAKMSIQKLVVEKQ